MIETEQKGPKKRSKKDYNIVGEIVPAILKKNAGKYFTAMELADIVVAENPTIIEDTPTLHDKKPDEIRVHFARTISSYNAKYNSAEVVVTSDSPHRYVYLRQTPTKPNTGERDERKLEQELYPVLTAYCKSIGIKTKRIDEKRSKHTGKNSNEWLHTDVVGYKDIAENFEEITKKVMSNYSQERGCLYAFEVKRGTILKSDVRSYVLETIANSSWANYSYLVAENIAEDAQDELALMCSSFKMGVIKLNRDTAEGTVIFPAPKTLLDWDMINRIAKTNKDFEQYLNNINQEYQRHENNLIIEPEWDKGIEP